jgi:glutaminyl-peptide cyclotransferase
MKLLLHKVFSILLFILMICSMLVFHPPQKTPFKAENAFKTLADLQNFGPRIPGSRGHQLAVNFITQSLLASGWQVKIQTGNIQNHPVQNIIASRNSLENATILASHYDSRMFANNDPEIRLQDLPVPGANDGGSSTVVLLELARILQPKESANIALVFFDSEDQGNIPGWDWILGSRYYEQTTNVQPQTLILMDMIGGYDQEIKPPSNSNNNIYQEIRKIAISLGYGKHFTLPSNHRILDDHVPFYDQGVFAVDLIDILDNRWHTTSDDLENVSLESLQRVGDTLYLWLLSQ